jgi:hypothetical protein
MQVMHAEIVVILAAEALEHLEPPMTPRISEFQLWPLGDPVRRHNCAPEPLARLALRSVLRSGQAEGPARSEIGIWPDPRPVEVPNSRLRRD